MLKIIVDKPAAGGSKGHICGSCQLSDVLSGPGWERNICSQFGEIHKQVTDCTIYKAKQGPKTMNDAPNSIMRAANYIIEYDGQMFFVSHSQYTAIRETYSHEKQGKMLRKWGFLRDE